MTQENKSLAVRAGLRDARSELPVSNITKEQATYLLKKAWPDAPDAEVMRAAIICQQYRFHPYMKRVYLVPFNKKDNTGKVIGKEWSIVLGIGATRQMVQAKHKYGFADGPRVMTEDEQMKAFGKVSSTDIVAIVKLQDRDGLIYPGYGRWPRTNMPKGCEKGNSPENMAFIRAERNALDKLAPGELPETDVIDESYEEKTMPQLMEEGREQVIEQGEQHIKDYWPVGEPLIDMTWLKESLKALNWNPMPYLETEYRVTGSTITEMVAKLNKDQAAEFVDEVNTRLKPTPNK